MTSRLAATVAGALLTLCWADAAKAVVGPSEEGSSIAASIVMVLNRSGGAAGFCTGVVLAPTVVMTAAHCAPPQAELRVYFPAAGSAPVLLPVTTVVRHPDYRSDAIQTRRRSIDLALVRLADPLPNRFVPASIAPSGGTSVGASFTLSGYGLGREDDPVSSGHLRSTVLSARLPLSNLLLWADDPRHGGAGACTGDSGAPVLAQGSSAVTALVVWSAGRGRQRCGALTQALWLAPQRDWIDGILRGWDVTR